MPAKNLATFGIYTDQVSACEAVDALKRTGFRSTDTSILLQDNLGSKDMGHEKHTKAPERAVVGVTLGALIGGVFGWLVAAGTFGMIPWILPYTGVEPIGTVLSGIGVGSVLGLAIGAIIGFEVPEYEAKRYIGRMRNGGILLSVHCDNTDWVRRAKDVLKQTGGRDIGVGGEAKADFGGGEKPLPRTRTTTVLARTDSSVKAVYPAMIDSSVDTSVRKIENSGQPTPDAYALPDGSDDDTPYISPRTNTKRSQDA